MKLALQQLPASVRGPARMKCLIPQAAAALIALERDTDGLDYLDIYRDPIASLASRRIRKGSQLPGYSSHGYGISFDLDVKKILDDKKITYETLLYVLKKRGWFCHRRDGDGNGQEAEHFNYLGDQGERYLTRCTMDPITWNRPAEERIYELHGPSFQVDLPACQRLLAKAGLYHGEFTDTLDPYTREAIMAFQRTWDLVEDGMATTALCRVLVFVTAERSVLQAA
jgi:Putative peptidoglycan binding domain